MTQISNFFFQNLFDELIVNPYQWVSAFIQISMNGSKTINSFTQLKRN